LGCSMKVFDFHFAVVIRQLVISKIIINLSYGNNLKGVQVISLSRLIAVCQNQRSVEYHFLLCGIKGSGIRTSD